MVLWKGLKEYLEINQINLEIEKITVELVDLVLLTDRVLTVNRLILMIKVMTREEATITIVKAMDNLLRAGLTAIDQREVGERTIVTEVRMDIEVDEEAGVATIMEDGTGTEVTEDLGGITIAEIPSETEATEVEVTRAGGRIGGRSLTGIGISMIVEMDMRVERDMKITVAGMVMRGVRTGFLRIEMWRTAEIMTGLRLETPRMPSFLQRCCLVHFARAVKPCVYKVINLCYFAPIVDTVYIHIHSVIQDVIFIE